MVSRDRKILSIYNNYVHNNFTNSVLLDYYCCSSSLVQGNYYIPFFKVCIFRGGVFPIFRFRVWSRYISIRSRFIYRLRSRFWPHSRFPFSVHIYFTHDIIPFSDLRLRSRFCAPLLALSCFLIFFFCWGGLRPDSEKHTPSTLLEDTPAHGKESPPLPLSSSLSPSVADMAGGSVGDALTPVGKGLKPSPSQGSGQRMMPRVSGSTGRDIWLSKEAFVKGGKGRKLAEGGGGRRARLLLAIFILPLTTDPFQDDGGWGGGW